MKIRNAYRWHSHGPVTLDTAEETRNDPDYIHSAAGKLASDDPRQMRMRFLWRMLVGSLVIGALFVVAVYYVALA